MLLSDIAAQLAVPVSRVKEWEEDVAMPNEATRKFLAIILGWPVVSKSPTSGLFS
jgi:DNA-binding transcriptional regulator YiaG